MVNEDDSPIKLAEQLGAVYGHAATSEMFYPQGLSILGRLKLIALRGVAKDEELTEIENLVAPYIDTPSVAVNKDLGRASYAAFSFCDELTALTSNRRYADTLLELASLDVFINALPEQPERCAILRVEDAFFIALVLGRAYHISSRELFLDALVRSLRSLISLMKDGLWRHSSTSPFFWGRGNGFAAMGLSEALSYLPTEHPFRKDILEAHILHLETLQKFQTEFGMWRQVVNDVASHPEHSGTSMVGYALAKGINAGWLSRRWYPATERAFRAVRAKTTSRGELQHVCESTDPLPTLDAYLHRSLCNGIDERGGAMALLFAVEMSMIDLVGSKLAPPCLK